MTGINPSIFKANDVRGKYPSEINEGVVSEIVSAALKNIGKKIVAGYDARLSSPALYEAVLSVLRKNGAEISEAGLCTSPEIYFLVNKLEADGGIMVTASHNPPEFNGLKIMKKNAAPMSGADILSKVQSFSQPASFAPAGKLAHSSPRSVAFGDHHTRSAAQVSKEGHEFYSKLYINFLKNFLKADRPLRIVFDASDGVAGVVLKELLAENKYIKAIFINSEPDGNFPGHGPNPLKEGALEQLKKEIEEHEADLGIIFDADGDRVFFMDERGERIDPDIVASILMKEFKPPYVVTTISSRRVKDVPGTSVSSVGHAFMKMNMRKNGANFGAERSGHYYFKYFFYCDSGILTAVLVINFLSSLKNKISNFIKTFPVYHQIPETNFEIKEDPAETMAKAKKNYESDAKKISESDGLLMEFPDWWFSIRVSGSENLLRLNMEADSEELLEKKLAEIKKLLHL